VGNDGIELLREAVALLDGTAVALERARALVDLGAAQRREGARRDARQTLERALEESRGCGARTLEERAREELAIVGGRPRRAASSGVAALTPSELRIARMAAEGLSNREIAEAVFVTIKAIEKHLAGAYRKLEIASRQDLPDALARRED
jgi:DNA-binding CsgD family transcriptional regulator